MTLHIRPLLNHRYYSCHILLVLFVIFTVLVYWYALPQNEMSSEVTTEPTSTEFPQPNNVPLENVLFVKSVYYYNTSTIYSNNTAIVLLFGNLPVNPNKLHCLSTNESGALTLTEAVLTEVNAAAFDDTWKVQMANCMVAQNVTNMSLVTSIALSSNIPLPIEPPSRQSRGIVACFAPMYYEKRWQALIVAHELYAAWGVDLQVHYVVSAIGDVLTLLEPFVVQALMEILPFDFRFTDNTLAKSRGFDVLTAMKTLAHQDCFLRYRESAEFIITADPEELFLPMNKGNLLEEFQYLRAFAPTAPAIATARAVGNVYTADMIEFYSFESTLNSITYKNNNSLGNVVYNPLYTETPWIHNQSAIYTSNEINVTSIRLEYVYDNTTFEANESTYSTRLIDFIDLISLFKPNGTLIDFPSVKAALNELPSFAENYQAMDQASLQDQLDECQNCGDQKPDFSCNRGVQHYHNINETFNAIVQFDGKIHAYIKLYDNGCMQNLTLF